MHPNPLFREDDRAALEAIITQAGFGMVFLTTPEGPRVAHVPLHSDGAGRIRFHLSRGNAMTRHLAGKRALIVVNGPDGYISPRWYDERQTVPTWDYVALEMEGTVSQLDDADLDALLYEVIDIFETRLGGDPWRAEEAGQRLWDGLSKGITGFEMTVDEWRPTIKLSQKRTPQERARIADGLEAAGNAALAQAMRGNLA